MSAPRTTKISFDEIYRETYKAFCIVVYKKQYWLPKSQVTMFEDKRVVFMSEKFAIDKELV